jgi:outer membrane protein TolC
MLRNLILALLVCAGTLGAQPGLPIGGSKLLKDGVTVLEAPRFGSSHWFRTHFVQPQPPRVSLRAPARLADFVVDGHLELSLRDYLELVLANNTEIAIQKLTIETPKNAITRALGRFDPAVVTTFRSTRTVSPTSSQLEGAQTLSQLTQPLSFAYQQTLETGTTYTIGFSGNKRSTNSAFATVNPSINASLDFSVTQPLLRNFGSYVNRLQVLVAESRLRQSRFDLENQLLRLLAQAETIYWNVVDARENLRVNQESLRLAEALLQRSERELELGAISPLDIFQPQQNRAIAEIAVTQSTYRLAQAVDALRQQIGADLDPDFRDMPIVLTEPVVPQEAEEPIDKEMMVELALRQRPDLRSALTSLEIDDLNYQSAKNFLKPDLSLTMSYSAAGLGGTFFEPLGGGAFRPIPGGLGDALNQVFGFNFPTYGFALSLRLPIRDRASVANLADAAVSKRLNSLRARQVEQQIRLEVLNAVNNVESSRARLKLAQLSVDFAQKRLDAEQKKYDLGVTTIFFLLDAQNRLAEAQSQLVTEASQYRRNLTNLLRVTGQLLRERNVVVD